MRRLILASCLALATAAIAGCASTDQTAAVAEAPPAPPASPAPAAEAAPAPETDIATVLASPSRSADDKQRDARDKTAEVLALAGFKPGQTVADILGGGGYHAEILSGIVGAQGKVLLVNDTRYDGFGKEGYTKRLAGNRLPNVRQLTGPADALGMGDATLDGAVIVMSYHDLYWVNDEKPGDAKIDAGRFLDQITAALKPGGVLLVVDHSAKAGTGNADTQKLHRIDEQFTAEDFRKHGLVLETSSDVLRNPADDRSKNVFDPAIRGKTDRFVQLYRKP